jgi:hypothetical protein
VPFFPPSGGGVSSGPGLNSATYYVSPLGSDTADGLTWSTAVETGYVGYAKIVAAGGGYLTIASGSSWGGPVAGQGAWFRGDGLTVAGWQEAVPCVIQGVGDYAQNPFVPPGLAVLHAGSNDAADYRLKPAVWLTYAEFPVQFRGIATAPSTGHADSQEMPYQSFRIGWDYNRNDDGTIMYQAITSSARTGSAGAGTTTHTAALSPAFTVTSARRLNNITTLTIPRPGTVKSPPWTQAVPFWFASTSGSFTAGAYSVRSCAANVQDDAHWDISYSDPGVDTGVISSPGTVRSAITTTNSFIDLESSSAQFPSTQYLVTAVSVVDATTCHISVLDVYGGYNGVNVTQGATANIGQLAHQERGFNATFGTGIADCSARSSQDVAKLYRMGPSIDIAGNVADTPVMTGTYLEGFKPTAVSGAPYDETRMVAGLIWGGPAASSGLIAADLKGSQTGFRVSIGQNTSVFQVVRATFDSNTGEAPAPYVIDGGASTTLLLQDISVADSSGGFGTDLASITGIPALNISGNSVYGFIGGAVGPARNAIHVSQSADSTNPWVNLTVGTWADLQITGKHPASWRNGTPANARFLNLLTGVASFADAPSSTGIADPFGGTGAVQYNDTTHASVNGKSGTLVYPNAVDTHTSFAAGGHYVVAGWFNYQNGAFDPDGLVSWFSGGDLVWESTGLAYWTKQPPFKGAGWQYIVLSDKVLSGSASQTYKIAVWGCPVGSGKVAQWFGLQAFWIPPTVSDNDAAEFIGTLRAQPYYLPPGMAGTFEGQQFIAHGGLGMSSTLAKTTGVASGQLTLTGSGTVYVPVYAADGVTIQGWTALLQATINP